ncbi:hypothetical protein GCM10027290_03610 [Micromonospora sonneratiae]|uniref:Heme lyase CcmF/NrfE family subunit n=1 Tax=Micromonospora sonneratiae TaxID=1184706 RepID=A0ABW3Y5L7_9ACTN
MTGTLGSSALAAGLITATGAALLWLRVALTGPATRRPARLLTGGMLLSAVVACAMLEWALLRHDFTVRFVAENGGRHVPVYYTVTSLWSALDGSLLLWLLILGGYATLLSRPAPRRNAYLQPWAMTVVSVVTVFFFALTYFAANPFQPVAAPPGTGPGPNPLLQQHPAMGLHPPLLYAGYIGLVIPFAYAVAALLTGRSGTDWLRAARNWTLLVWALLTAGITLGAWWSYAVLGWGGYWAWDPVENASLLPWLTATAFLHSGLLPGRRTRAAGWPVSLACASFLLVLVGTFLTRSGSVASVHAFTESALGPMLLGFVLLTAATVIGLIGWRAHLLGNGVEANLPGSTDDSIGRPLLTRRTALRGNTVLLTTLTAVVLIGTVFPLVAQALTGTRTAVGPPYFNRTAVPLMITLLVLMGVAPLLGRETRPVSETLRRLALPTCAALAVVTAVGLVSRPGPAALAAFGGAAFVVTGAARLLVQRLRVERQAGTADHGRPAAPGRPGTAAAARPGRGVALRRRAVDGLLAHAGIALVAVGVAGSSAYTTATEAEVTVGQTITVGGTSARLVAVDRRGGEADMVVSARLALDSGSGGSRTVAAQLRHYPARDMTIGIPGIRAGLLRDSYATLIAVSPDGHSATVRLAVSPLVGLLWAGGALTVLGGLLAIGRRPRQLTDRGSTGPGSANSGDSAKASPGGGATAMTTASAAVPRGAPR